MESSTLTDADRLRLWRVWCATPGMPFPEILRGLQCGAKTRAGTPCKNTALFRNGRCKFHGGKSTGPRTVEGKARSSQNARKRANPVNG